MTYISLWILDGGGKLKVILFYTTTSIVSTVKIRIIDMGSQQERDTGLVQRGNGHVTELRSENHDRIVKRCLDALGKGLHLGMDMGLGNGNRQPYLISQI